MSNQSLEFLQPGISAIPKSNSNGVEEGSTLFCTFSTDILWGASDSEYWLKLNDLIITTAPVTGLTIRQGVDYTLSKTLGNNYIVSTFGDRPVTIVLDGITIFTATPSLLGSLLNDQRPERQLAYFYKKYNAHADPKMRINVNLRSPRFQSANFKCIMVGLELLANEHSGTVGAGAYKLEMIGVPFD